MISTTSQPDSKPPRTTAPASLLSQWWTLGTITADRRTTGRHAKVAWVIIDRYRQDKGNGRASVRYIARACDLSASVVAKACRELVEWGYFSQNVGIGTRPTEFTPKWATVPPVSNAKAVDISVLQGSHACVLQDSNASDDSVLLVSHESYLPYPADKAGLRVSRNEFEAAPVAPLADGLGAAAAGPASGGFEEFWSIWPRKHGKAAARVAYGRVDETDHDTIAAAARAWAEHYSKHDVEKKWIPEPANWLAKERWDEDLPIIHGDSKGAAIAKAKANAIPPTAASAKIRTPMVGKIDDFSPFGTFTARIVNAQVFTTVDTEALRIELEWDGGRTWHKFSTRLEDSERHAEGQAMLASITRAAGIEGKVEDSDELLFRPMLCTIEPGEGQLVISYSPLASNENHTLESAA